MNTLDKVFVAQLVGFLIVFLFQMSAPKSLAKTSVMKYLFLMLALAVALYLIGRIWA